MVVPYESITEEEHRRRRRDRLRSLASGAAGQEEFYGTAGVLANMWELCQDAVIGLHGLQAEGKELHLAEKAVG